MTEYSLGDGALLGLMPEAGTQRLLGLPRGAGPRAELYLLIDDPAAARALEAGTLEFSPLLPRDWGHRAAYPSTRTGTHPGVRAERLTGPSRGTLSSRPARTRAASGPAGRHGLSAMAFWRSVSAVSRAVARILPSGGRRRSQPSTIPRYSPSELGKYHPSGPGRSAMK